MKDPNENRPGYKQTKVGWIPEEWADPPLCKVAVIQTGLAKGKNGFVNQSRARTFVLQTFKTAT